MRNFVARNARKNLWGIAFVFYIYYATLPGAACFPFGIYIEFIVSQSAGFITQKRVTFRRVYIENVLFSCQRQRGCIAAFSRLYTLNEMNIITRGCSMFFVNYRVISEYT